ncbi:hypothetical protein CBR_g30693 [Chara braunii]|uniref:Uncharacterized protein n=1 Tax=Chara braunii TaxID=69332 RepID=A0A388LDE3_CHABU|nr:hypothetical protein CBR_g30693 [Chara braunii]|eukprot:GBG80325.1 hypothetical protein CBR_g30693 [Chara braunii]
MRTQVGTVCCSSDFLQGSHPALGVTIQHLRFSGVACPSAVAYVLCVWWSSKRFCLSSQLRRSFLGTYHLAIQQAVSGCFAFGGPLRILYMLCLVVAETEQDGGKTE